MSGARLKDAGGGGGEETGDHIFIIIGGEAEGHAMDDQTSIEVEMEAILACPLGHSLITASSASRELVE